MKPKYKLKKFYRVLTFSTVNKNWVPYEEFEDQEDQLTFLTKLSKDEGILDEDILRDRERSI